MTFFSKLSELFERAGDSQSRLRGLREEELRVAAAALLVNASAIDGEVAPEERRKLKALLQERFELGDDACRRLIREAEAREREAVDLYGFTSVLCAQLDQDGRKRIIEMLWEMAMADGVLHEFEANLIWRVAELLGVSARERVRLKKLVAARVGFDLEDSQ